MLYLLRSYGKDDSGNLKSILKVGYASDLDYRLSQYLAHNPFIELLSTRDGDLDDEKLLHIYLHFLGYGELKDEWYKDIDDVVNVFKNIAVEDLKLKAWENRESIFKGVAINKRNAATISLYKSLLSLCGKDLIPIYLVSPNKEITNENSLPIDKRFFSYFESTEDYNTRKLLYPKFYEIHEQYCKSLDNFEIVDEERKNEIVERFISLFNSSGIFNEKMEYLCTFIKEFESYYKSYYNYIYSFIPRNYQNYIEQIGVDKIKSLEYEEKKILNYIDSMSNLNNSMQDIIDLFKVGEKYINKQIKSILSDFYTSHNINRSPKATDLLEWFDVKDCKITVEGKRINGLEILKRK